MYIRRGTLVLVVTICVGGLALGRGVAGSCSCCIMVGVVETWWRGHD